MSDEEKEIFNNLKDYMQSNIDNGYHKFIYNDLGWDFKCIDCINAIDTVLKQSKEIEEYKKQLDLDYVDKHFVPIERYNQLEKEIEELKEESKEYQIGFAQGCYEKDLDWEDKIKAKIEELKQKKYILSSRESEIEILKSLLEKE